MINKLHCFSFFVGLTPPATPPHHTCKPLIPVKRTKHESMKPSSSKTIQIIEPRPLPPSKTHSKPPMTSVSPALNPARAFIDHDYCSTSHTDTRSPSRAGSEDRTERLSGSVLLSPDTSPCRTDAFNTLQFSSRSPSPQDHGRTRRRGYNRRYHRSNSSSRSSCSSCSSSSSSRSRSRSPARKRSVKAITLHKSWKIKPKHEHLLILCLFLGIGSGILGAVPPHAPVHGLLLALLHASVSVADHDPDHCVVHSHLNGTGMRINADGRGQCERNLMD